MSGFRRDASFASRPLRPIDFVIRKQLGSSIDMPESNIWNEMWL